MSVSLIIWKEEDGDCVVENISLSDWLMKFPCNHCSINKEIDHEFGYVHIVCPVTGFRAMGDFSKCICQKEEKI